MVMPVQAPQSSKASMAAVVAIAAVVALVLTLVTQRDGAATSTGAVATSTSGTSAAVPAGLSDSTEGNPTADALAGAEAGDLLEEITEPGNPAPEGVEGDAPSPGAAASTTTSGTPVPPTGASTTTQPPQPGSSTTTTQPAQPDADDDEDQPDRAADPLEPPPPEVTVNQVEFAGAADAHVDLTGRLGSEYVLLDVGLGPNSTFFMMDEDEDLVGVDLNTAEDRMDGTVVVTSMEAAQLLVVGSASSWSATFRGVEATDLLSPNGSRQGSGSDVMAFAVAPAIARVEAHGCDADARIEMHSYGGGALIMTTLFRAGDLPSVVSVSPATEMISLRTECAWTLFFES